MVIEGDLKNLMGRVTRVADDGKVDVTFEPGQLEKFFEVRAAAVPKPCSCPCAPSLHTPSGVVLDAAPS